MWKIDGPKLSYLSLSQIPVESESVSDQLSGWRLAKIRAEMVANDIPMNSAEFSFGNRFEARLDAVIGKRIFDGLEDVLGQLLDVLGVADPDRAIKLDVPFHVIEESLGGYFMTVPCRHET